MTAESDRSMALAEPAALAAALLAIAPHLLRGANLRAPAGAARDAWIDLYCTLSCQPPPIRLPPSVTDDALDGGLDLSATLSTGIPIYRPGVLRSAAGRTLLLAMAERWPRHTAARFASAMDLSDVADTFTVIALDEGIDGEERTPDSLLDRVAFNLAGVPAPSRDGSIGFAIEDVTKARSRLRSVEAPDTMIEMLVDVAARLGIASSRPIQFAVHAARAHAGLFGRYAVDESDVTAAATLVLAPRGIQIPASSTNESDRGRHSDDDMVPDVDQASSEPVSGASPQDRIVAACAVHLPKHLLDGLRSAACRRGKDQRRRGSTSKLSGRQGRAVGARRGVPKHGERLSLSATLLAAAPWQRLRQRDESARRSTSPRPFYFRKDDLRLHRHKQTQRVTTVFSVDASGSSAVRRLAEAKGAVEQLLAQSYVRRDRVALIAFRARRAEALLHPTRSLARARRALAELPGGGATPLASGIREAHAMASAVLRSGQQCHVVILTDGCANMDTEGRAGRPAALDEALLMARRLRADGIASLVIDISPTPGQQSLALAEALGALYVPLPHGGAESISETVRQFRRAGDAGIGSRPM